MFYLAKVKEEDFRFRSNWIGDGLRSVSGQKCRLVVTGDRFADDGHNTQLAILVQQGKRRLPGHAWCASFVDGAAC